MDRISDGWDLTSLLAVLSHGQEQTRQLEAHLDVDQTRQQLVLCKSLARQIESTFQTAISVVEGSSSRKLTGMGTDTSPSSATDSLQSSKSPDRDMDRDRDRVVFDDDHERMEIMCNKRKSALRWTRQVRVRPAGAGIEEPPLADGYSWRKYGQKDILGAKYPRGYYRCTHRNSRGCLATKQVQRSDEDPYIMDVTYRGAHTCTETKHKHETTVVEASFQQDTGVVNSHNNDLLQQLQQQQQQPPLMSLRAPVPLALKKTDDDLNSKGQILDSSSFSYPCTPASNCLQRHDSSTCSPTTLENSFLDTFSPSAFMLARTSEMNYLPLSRCGVSNYGAQETELAEMLSSARSTANTPISDMDLIGFRQGDFGTDFPFDGSSF